jgi:hypothetical protein
LRLSGRGTVVASTWAPAQPAPTIGGEP